MRKRTLPRGSEEERAWHFLQSLRLDPTGLERVVLAWEDDGLKVARAVYQEEFDIHHDDPRIDEEIEALVRDAILWADPPVTRTAVPLRLLLALLLRERFGARKRGAKPKSPFAVAQERVAVGLARKHKAALMKREKLSAAEATNRVVDEFSKRTKLSRAKLRRQLGDHGGDDKTRSVNRRRAARHSAE